jgi:hypothetical protein
MMESKAKETEVLVLSDGEGNFYAIPREMVERHKLSAEGKVMVEKLLGDDVSGYMLMEPRQLIVDPAGGLSAGAKRLEGSGGTNPSSGPPTTNTVSMLPLTALTGFFAVVHDLSRYLEIEESNIRLA